MSTVELDVQLSTSLPGICNPTCLEDYSSDTERFTILSPVSQRSNSSFSLFIGSGSCQSSSCSSPLRNEIDSPGKEGKKKRRLAKKRKKIA